MKKAVRLNRNQLRRLIERTVNEAGSEFKLTDVAALVEDDAELFDAMKSLIETLNVFVDTLAKKEGLVPQEDYAFMDAMMSEADNAVRKCVYDFIENAVATAHEAG